MITLAELRAIMPFAGKRAEVFIEPLNATMLEFEINNPLREAAFLAQIAHESGELRYVRELATGEAYEGRKDLGNTNPGDGVRYKGRGLIQVTGTANYRACGVALGVDLLADPGLLEQPLLAARSAGWFWSVKKLNELADKGDFLLITKRINGGTNGWAARVAYYERAKKVFAQEGQLS